MSEIAGLVPEAKCLSRTTPRQTTAVKWRRLWLVKDILMSLARQSGAELGRCEARNDADATDAKFKGVCILRRATRLTSELLRYRDMEARLSALMFHKTFSSTAEVIQHLGQCQLDFTSLPFCTVYRGRYAG